MRKAALAGLVVFAFALVLTGCSVTAPVKGKTESGSESFDGTTTGYLDGSGDITVVTSKGVTCTGEWVSVTRRQGEGVFNCSDGRSGPFRFVSSGNRGTGTGRIGNENFTFTFARE